MTITTSQVSFGLVETTEDSEELLVLEQEDWDQDTGLVTKANLARFIYSLLQSMTTGNKVTFPLATDCGLEDGDLVTKIFAYPKVDGLVFTIAVTNGTLESQGIETITNTDLLSFQGTSEETLDYPCHSVISKEVKGGTFDSDKNSLSEPEITIDGDTVSLSFSAYTAVKVVYETIRYVYKLTIPARDSTYNKYASVVYAYYSGGVVWLDVDEPDTLDDSEDSVCGYNIRWGPSPLPPIKHPGGTTNNVKTIDYCSQEVESEEIENL
jgi:hypothetical protein